MRKLFTAIAFLLFAQTIYAQQQDSLRGAIKAMEFKKNATYLEGLGNAGYGAYSLNYEREIHTNDNGFTTVRIGISYNSENVIFPILHINHINNIKKKNHFEVGGGMTLAFDNYPGDKLLALDTYWSPSINANLMYRYQKPGGEFIFRAGWTPVIYPNLIKDTGGYIIYAFLFGVSVGYGF